MSLDLQHWAPWLLPILQIIMIDLVLAGDNAIVVGLAASRVEKTQRAKVIFWGILGAVIIRILFAAITMQLLAIVGLALAGGLLLLWVCYKMFRELRRGAGETEIWEGDRTPMSVWSAITSIVVADVSMSLDNVLAVAGAAKDNLPVLVGGLLLSIALMAIAANYIARLLTRYPWISWAGLAIILYVAVDMIHRGLAELGLMQ